MSNNGSIFSDDDENPRPKKGTPTPSPQIQPASIPRRRWRVTYPIFRDILLALVFLVALPMEMLAPEMYKPSTWIGNRLGLLAGQQQTAQADDQIGVITRVETETAGAKADAQSTIARGTADAQADAQSTIARGTADAQADAAAVNAAEQADIRLMETERMEATMAEVRLAVQLTGQCENQKLAEYHNAEVMCETDTREPYGVCLNRIQIIRDRQCPALPDPSAYPENMRKFVRDRVATANKSRKLNQAE